MKGLPGRLTIRHIELAKERGDNYIFYKGINYSLKELEDGAGISRAKPKSKTSANVHSSRTDNSNGKITKLSGDSLEE